MEPTNNKCENYIGKIIDKVHKVKFKTAKGFFNYILHRIEGWIEDHINYIPKKRTPKNQKATP